MAEGSNARMRADARRNREKILTAAARVFATEGLDAHLERIAKEAGVGSATLYRNFPTREALVEAVYRNEVAQLCDAAPALLAAKPPLDALRAWTRLFLDYVTTKYGMIDALRAIAATGSNPYGHSREMIQAALSSSWTLAWPPGRSAPTSAPRISAPPSKASPSPRRAPNNVSKQSACSTSPWTACRPVHEGRRERWPPSRACVNNCADSGGPPGVLHTHLMADVLILGRGQHRLQQPGETGL